MATHVAGDTYRDIDGQLFEIKRQLRQPNGYPFDPELLKLNLQAIVEGRFSFGQQPEGPVTIGQVPQPGLFKAEDTNLSTAIAVAEHFTNKVLGVKVDLRKQFDFPSELPWEDVLVIYDPSLNNREAVEKAIHGQGINKSYEEVNVMEYSGSEASGQPTLRIIENSIRPTEDTLGASAKSPDQLNVDGRTYLDLRGYALAFGLRYFASKDYLDPKTWTWFPKNRLPGGEVAFGLWDPFVDCRRVGFCWDGAGRVDPGFGARLAIDVKLKP